MDLCWILCVVFYGDYFKDNNWSANTYNEIKKNTCSCTVMDKRNNTPVVLVSFWKLKLNCLFWGKYWSIEAKNNITITPWCKLATGCVVGIGKSYWQCSLICILMSWNFGNMDEIISKIWLSISLQCYFHECLSISKPTSTLQNHTAHLCLNYFLVHLRCHMLRWPLSSLVLLQLPRELHVRKTTGRVTVLQKQIVS